MSKAKTSTVHSQRVRQKAEPIRRNKVKKQPDFVPYSYLSEENEESINFYQDDDAYRRISSIRPQQDWDEEDELNIWWNWSN